MQKNKGVVVDFGRFFKAELRKILPKVETIEQLKLLKPENKWANSFKLMPDAEKIKHWNKYFIRRSHYLNPDKMLIGPHKNCKNLCEKYNKYPDRSSIEEYPHYIVYNAISNKEIYRCLICDDFILYSFDIFCDKCKNK
jgi:hypothetical protein